MEPLSTLIEGERNFFSEEADFMSHLFTNFSTKLPNLQDSSAFWPHNESINETSASISDDTNGNMLFLLQENSYTDGNDSVFFSTSSGESYLSVSCSRGSRKGVTIIPSADYNNLSPISRKHSCSLEDVRTSWKKPKLTKSQKLVSKVNIDAVDPDADYDSCGGQDVIPRTKGVEMLNTNGKKRASSGSAIDSQSVYAKKRREKINERLRILQNLVPNGTKVDISTMLEEAVEYVKFLQLQIKLLSSDDLWMYAPIAYNGMDLGLLVDISSPR